MRFPDQTELVVRRVLDKVAIRVYTWRNAKIEASITIIEDEPVIVRSLGALRIKDMVEMVQSINPDHNLELYIRDEVKDMIPADAIADMRDAFNNAKKGY